MHQLTSATLAILLILPAWIGAQTYKHSNDTQSPETQSTTIQEDPAALQGDLIAMLDRSISVTIEPIGFIPRDIDLSDGLQQYTYDTATDMGVDPDVVFEIMWRESRYQVDAVGYNSNGTTDIGLMQINSCNWGWLADEGIDVHDPYGNIEAGILMLSMFSEKYDDEGAIACYAAGETGMRRGRGFGYAREVLDSI